MGRSKRWGIRSLVVLAISVVTVVALATAAGALRIVAFRISSLDNLEKACALAGGEFTVTPQGAGLPVIRECRYPDGGVITCTGYDCVLVTPRKNLDSLRPDIRELGGRSISEVSDHSKVWGQTGPKGVNTVGALQEGGCSDLGGEFVSSQDSTVGLCRTPTATIVCHNFTSRNTCVGFADTAKNAKLARKKVSASLNASSVTTTAGSPTTTSGSTTTTGATTTTRPTTPTTRG
jgi:hypothetical protein